MAYLNKLPFEYLDLNDMGTQSRGVSVIYGRRTDGSLVAIKTQDDGSLAVVAALPPLVGFSTEVTLSALNTKFVTTANGIKVDGSTVTQPVHVVGSSDSFYSDNTITALTGAFVLQPFGFTSQSITVINEAAAIMDFSFDGVNIHGKLKNFESTVMDYRAQSGIYLRSSVPGSAYRVWSY